MRADELKVDVSDNEQRDSAGDIPNGFAPARLGQAIKSKKKELFWVWIAYQSVKGLITTSLIWIPLFVWWKGG